MSQVHHFWLTLCLLFPLHACAWSAVTTTPTFHSVSIRVPAPAASSTTCGLRYRPDGSASWKPAHPLDLDSSSAEYRGSIVNLEPKSKYEIAIDLSPAPSPTLSARATTRSERTSATYHTVWHVSQQGSDAAAGTETDPFRTIQHAVNKAQGGQMIRVHPGTYPEKILIKNSGVPGQPLQIIGSPTGDTIIDASSSPDNAVTLSAVSHVALSNLCIQYSTASLILIQGGSSHITVENSTLTNPGNHYFNSAIEVGPGCSNIIIRNNHITFTGRTYTGGRMGIALRETLGGHIICNNVIMGNHQVKDGIGGSPNFGINGGPHCDSDIYNNTISGCVDDGIEAEGGAINVRIWGNTISNCLVGLGLAPVIKGPCFVWRNRIINCGPAFKLGEGDHMGHGPLYLYHNTSYSAVPEDGGYAGSGGKGLFQHVHARNNLLSLAGRVFYDNRKQTSNSYDYDLLFTTNPKRLMAWGKGNSITLEDARALGFWHHAVTADPLLKNPPHDLTLQPGSPAVDAGEILPNYNDNFRGKAPDIGAHESQ